MPKKIFAKDGQSSVRETDSNESEEPLLPLGEGTTVNYDEDAHERRRSSIGPQGAYNPDNEGIHYIGSRR